MTVMILLVSNPNMWDKVEELTPAFFGGFCLDVRFFLAPCQHLQLAYVAEMGAYKALKFWPTQPTHMRIDFFRVWPWPGRGRVAVAVWPWPRGRGRVAVAGPWPWPVWPATKKSDCGVK